MSLSGTELGREGGREGVNWHECLVGGWDG